MRITFIVPNLFLPPAPGGMLDPYRDLHLPQLEWLFARGMRQASPGLSLEAFLFRGFGINDTQPVASVSHYTDTGADGGASAATYWLRADPVHLQTQRDQLALIDGAMLAISAAEAAALTASLNQHFAQDQLKFIPAHPTRWYLALDAAPDLITQPLPSVAGKSINTYLPRGAHAMRWNQIATEIQMLLHAHPINAAREALGQPAINSLWFWGGGVRPAFGSPPYEHFFANDALACGLALATKQLPQPLPINFDALLAHANPAAASCVVWDTLRRAAWYGDHYAWRMGVARLESDWIKPLTAALRRGVVSEIRFHALSDQACLTVRVDRAARWQFWRHSRTLKHYLPGHA